MDYIWLSCPSFNPLLFVCDFWALGFCEIWIILIETYGERINHFCSLKIWESVISCMFFFLSFHGRNISHLMLLIYFTFCFITILCHSLVQLLLRWCFINLLMNSYLNEYILNHQFSLFHGHCLFKDQFPVTQD